MEHKTITEFQLVDINRLVPYINNARTHSPEQINKLRASLREFGFVNPIIVDRDYNVLAGHGRLIGAKAEGYKEVPCVFVDEMTEAQKKAYIIADNRMAMDAGWDEELLRVEIESLQGMDFDPLLTGFEEKELATCLVQMMRRRKMTSMWKRNWRSPAFPKQVTSGGLENIPSSAGIPQTRRRSVCFLETRRSTWSARTPRILLNWRASPGGSQTTIWRMPRPTSSS